MVANSGPGRKWRALVNDGNLVLQPGSALRFVDGPPRGDLELLPTSQRLATPLPCQAGPPA